MHKQKFLIIPVVAMIVIASACSARPTGASEGRMVPGGGNLEQSVAVEVQPVEAGDLSVSNTLTAEVVFQLTVDVTSDVDGELLTLSVEKGDHVTKGQVLAEVEVDTEEIENTIAQEEISLEKAKQSFDSAKISEEQSKQKLEQTKSSLEKAKLSAESARLSSEKSNIELEIELKSLQNQLNTAEDELKRIQNYFKEGIASQKELDEVEMARDEAALAYDKAKAAFNSNAITYEQAQIEGESLEVDVASAEKDVEKSQISVNQAQSDIEAAELRIQQARDLLEDGRIHAHITGEITAVNYVEGENVSGQESLLTISSSENTVVEAFVTSEYRKLLTVGKEVDLQDFSGESKTKVTVTYVASNTNESGLYEVEFAFKEKNDAFRAGEAVQLVFTNIIAQDQIVIPTDTILEEGGKSHVFVVEDGKAVKRAIEVINMQTDSSSVKGEIKEGDTLVVTGHKLLSDGMNVTLPGEESAPSARPTEMNGTSNRANQEAPNPGDRENSSGNQGGRP